MKITATVAEKVDAEHGRRQQVGVTMPTVLSKRVLVVMRGGNPRQSPLNLSRWEPPTAGRLTPACLNKRS